MPLKENPNETLDRVSAEADVLVVVAPENLDEKSVFAIDQFLIRGGSVILGTFNSAPGKTYRIEFFSNSSVDPSGYGEGQTFLGYANVTTDSSGNAVISETLTVPVPVGQFVTATATDPDNNTSEFSRTITVAEPGNSY